MSSKWVNSSNCGGNSLKAKLTSHSVAQILKKKKEAKITTCPQEEGGRLGNRGEISLKNTQREEKGREGKGRKRRWCVALTWTSHGRSRWRP
jgi:hypothetical protein